MSSLYNETCDEYQIINLDPKKLLKNETVTFIIPGQPIPQKRHRYHNRGSFTCTYDPSSEDKKELKKYIKACSPPPLNKDYIYFVEIFFYFEPGKSLSKLERNKLLWQSWHSFKPDNTNLAKFYEDALNEILWDDDCKIVFLSLKKKYSEKPFTKINIMAKKKLEFYGNNEILTQISPTELRELSNACKIMGTVNIENIEDFLGDFDEKGSPAANAIIDFVKNNSQLISKLAKQIEKRKL
jgi:Holliday junction resolvase RusA-like endonuclease